MRSYSHLSEDERDQIGVLRAAGRSMGCHCPPGARSRAKAAPSPRELAAEQVHSLWAGTRRFTAAGAYQLRRRRGADPRTRGYALRLFVGDRRLLRMDARTDLQVG